jgi:hypothetical protein
MLKPFGESFAKNFGKQAEAVQHRAAPDGRRAILSGRG